MLHPVRHNLALCFYHKFHLQRQTEAKSLHLAPSHQRLLSTSLHQWCLAHLTVSKFWAVPGLLKIQFHLRFKARILAVTQSNNKKGSKIVSTYTRHGQTFPAQKWEIGPQKGMGPKQVKPGHAKHCTFLLSLTPVIVLCILLPLSLFHTLPSQGNIVWFLRPSFEIWVSDLFDPQPLQSPCPVNQHHMTPRSVASLNRPEDPPWLWL